jgi:tetratricopeptide (TPR) repeat protein
MNRIAVLAVFALVAGSSGFAKAPSEVESLLHAGRVSEAMVAAEGEIASDPGDVEAHERYIDILHTVGLSHRARAIYSGWITKYPTQADAYYLFGRAVNSVEEAQETYNKALTLDEHHARSHMGLAAVDLATGQLDAAVAGYKLAAEADSSLSEAWQGWTRSLVLQDKVPEALAVARRAMEAVPNEAEPYLTIAVLQPDEAIKVLSRGAEMNPNDPRPYARLAELFIEGEEPSQAVVAAKYALSIDPNLPDANRSLVFAKEIEAGVLDKEGYRLLLEAQASLSSAADFGYAKFDALVKSYPRSALAWMGRSQSRLRLSHLDGARIDLGQAAKLSPDNADIQAAYGLILVKMDRGEEATVWLRKARKNRPTDVSVAVALGQAQIMSGDLTGGMSTFQVTYSKFPYDARAALAYAEALANNRESLAAYKVLLEAFRRKPDGRVLVSLIAAARDVGRYGEAADMLESLGKQAGSQVLLDEAVKLRELLKRQ